MTDEEVSKHYSPARREIEAAINEVIISSRYGALTEWAHIGIVLGPRFNLSPGEEIKKYRKKAQEFEFRLEIDHATFKAADALGHRKLIMASLLRSIDEMRKLVPKGIDYDRLEKDVRDVAAAKGWLPDASHIAAAAPPAPAPPPGVSEGDIARKLYKRIDGVLFYEEAWTHEGILTRHWGKVGQKGKTSETPFSGKRPSDAVQSVLSKAMANGFAEIPFEKMKEVLIQFTIDGFGTTEELDKLHALEEELDQSIGWLGLGHCDGNSIGSDTMEVCCFVVDADIAIKCIKKSLKGTRFANGATFHVVDRGEEDDEKDALSS